jgi:hypothetical protein
MGLIQRKKSGNIMTGSRLIVEGQPMLSAKVFEVGFLGKKGSLPDEHRESPTTTTTTIPTTTTTTTIPVEVLINPIITNSDEYIDVGNEEYLEF